MRQIHEMAKMIAHVMLNAEVCSTVAEPVDAVNRLADNNTKNNLIIGLEFYSHLSDMDENFLESNAYSLVKARTDFKAFADKFGLNQMTDLYFGSDSE